MVHSEVRHSSSTLRHAKARYGRYGTVRHVTVRYGDAVRLEYRGLAVRRCIGPAAGHSRCRRHTQPVGNGKHAKKQPLIGKNELSERTRSAPTGGLVAGRSAHENRILLCANRNLIKMDFHDPFRADFTDIPSNYGSTGLFSFVITPVAWYKLRA